jgi:predicted double-glycine peptidase
MSRTVFRSIFSCALLFCLCICLPSRANDRHLIKQTTGYDCGPAALATLLTHYLDVPSQEMEIAVLSSANQYGTTLLGLELAMQAKGGGAQSFRMDFATLRRQLDAYPAPVLVRLLLPQPHFVLVLAVEDDMVLLADPASGNVMMPHKAFLERWLIPQSAEGKEKKADENTQSKVPAREGYVLIAARADGRTNVTKRGEVVGELRRQRQLLKSQRVMPALRR